MRGERNAFLLDVAQLRQREHLKSAAVRQDRAVPVHKLMQAAHLLHYIVSRTDVQVVCVGQFDLTTDLLQVMGGQAALDGRLCAHIHKYRGLSRAVGAGEFAAARLSLRFDDFKHFLFSQININR